MSVDLRRRESSLPQRMVHAPHVLVQSSVQPTEARGASAPPFELAGSELAPAAAAPCPGGVDVPAVWPLILELGARARAERAVATRAGFALRAARWVELGGAGPALPNEGEVWFDGTRARLDQASGLTAEALAIVALFAPLVSGRRAQELVLGHLGQSLDGRVATPTGASQFITSHDDLVHTHRLRALFDAVLVGVRTVELDDPLLTTRLVSGPHPTRVVLDPRGKLVGRRRRLLEDDASATLVFGGPAALPEQRVRGSVTWLECPCSEGALDLRAVLSALRARGLRRVFVEGGGVTVSRFLAAGLLDRLHVSVAPLILGSGAPAFTLPPIDRLEEALELRCQHHALGRDVLFDCELIKKSAQQA